MEEQVYQSITFKVLDELGLTEYDFNMGQQVYMTSPEY